MRGRRCSPTEAETKRRHRPIWARQCLACSGSSPASCRVSRSASSAYRWLSGGRPRHLRNLKTRNRRNLQARRTFSIGHRRYPRVASGRPVDSAADTSNGRCRIRDVAQLAVLTFEVPIQTRGECGATGYCTYVCHRSRHNAGRWLFNGLGNRTEEDNGASD